MGLNSISSANTRTQLEVVSQKQFGVVSPLCCGEEGVLSVTSVLIRDRQLIEDANTRGILTLASIVPNA